MGQFGTPYLQTRGRVFYYRRILACEDGQNIEIKLSLQTSEPKTAKIRCGKLNALINSMHLTVWNEMKFTKEHILEITRNYLQQALNDAEDEMLVMSWQKEEIRDSERQLTERDLALYRKALPSRQGYSEG